MELLNVKSNLNIDMFPMNKTTYMFAVARKWRYSYAVH